ncbi:glycerate kinase [Paenibacillus sp. LHD-117]|uniref:glycerate kinase n=1 Tax=Paenibacillus sp. LHD-117 TaxID=3071412 RepID=UPI0027DEC625|nr:glycerate kinase [Paenibacillus sp. LHD-117]MDQ6420413.1 glycerate kinase [Paenibacillus sp. LHD-117]
MRVLVAPDSYKGSLTAAEVAACMEKGILDVLPQAAVIKLPIADGGEGTVDAIVNATGGQLHQVEVLGPLGEPVTATFGVMGDGQTAVVEMASASGLLLIAKDRLNPLRTTTYGTGQLIQAALDQGCRRIVIGIGGSATNDGGAGMAQALGVRFFNDQGSELSYGGGELISLSRVDVSGLDPRVADCEIIVASDVTNPLCGPEGASFVFGPQKGATPEMAQRLDDGLRNYGRVIHERLGIDVRNVPGAGAAGGLGAGLIAFLSARMSRGIDIVLEAIEFEKRVQEADLVITGEGRTDSQTAFGKAPAGVAALAKKYNKPVICVSGGISLDTKALHEAGIDVIIGATQSPMSLEEAMANASDWIRHAVASVIRTSLLPINRG